MAMAESLDPSHIGYDQIEVLAKWFTDVAAELKIIRRAPKG
jgi:hypothetical protein